MPPRQQKLVQQIRDQIQHLLHVQQHTKKLKHLQQQLQQRKPEEQMNLLSKELNGAVDRLKQAHARHDPNSSCAFEYAQNGFLNIEQNLIDSLTDAGFKWGGQYESSKDFMHFELHGYK